MQVELDAPFHSQPQAGTSAKHSKPNCSRSTLLLVATLLGSTLLLITGLWAAGINMTADGGGGLVAQAPQSVCRGDTRGDRRCDHDETHRVCAEIGDPDTSFWQHTGQHSWCNTAGHYSGPHGGDMRCPLTEPTWCICKWATADWIKGEGCSENINIDCAASDICATPLGLFFSYDDFDVALQPAHECVALKCPEIWAACEAANPTEAPNPSAADQEEQPPTGGH